MKPFLFLAALLGVILLPGCIISPCSGCGDKRATPIADLPARTLR